MLNPGDTADRLDEFTPTFPLGFQNLFAGGCEPVITATALTGFLHPAATDPAALFQAVEERIKGSHIETKRAAGAQFDELSEFVAMPRPIFDERQDQQLGTALF